MTTEHIAAEELTVPVRLGADFVVGTLTVTHDEPVRISLRLDGGTNLTAEGPDLPSALRDLRLQVEDQGGLLWVNGARRNVRASAMLRQVGSGREAYVLPEQPSAERPPVVDILLGASPDADVVTVADQEGWFRGYRGAREQEPARVRPPSPEAVAEAARNPGAWVYEIDGEFGPDDAVPPEAVRGAWKVDEHGRIVGEFVENPNFKTPGDSPDN